MREWARRNVSHVITYCLFYAYARDRRFHCPKVSHLDKGRQLGFAVVRFSLRLQNERRKNSFFVK